MYTSEEKKKWLLENFDKIETNFEAAGEYRLTIPDHFVIFPAYFGSKILAQIIERHHIKLRKMSVSGETEEDAYSKLFNAVAYYSCEENLVRHLKKENQADDVLKPEKIYRTVHSHQALHDHESDRLIDFDFVDLSACVCYESDMPIENLKLAMSDFDSGEHMHLLHNER